MSSPERLRVRRCIALRVAVFFAVLLAAFNWRDWAIVAIAVAGGLLALAVYWRDCRKGAKSSRTDAHTRGLQR